MLILVFDIIKMFDAQAFFSFILKKNSTRNSFKYAKVWSLSGQLKNLKKN